VHAWCNAFIASDTELHGTLDQLEEGFAPDDDVFDAIDDQEEAQAMELCEGDSNEEELSADDA